MGEGAEILITAPLEKVIGVGPAAAAKLRKNGITCVETLAVYDPMEIHQLTKIGEGTCMKIVKNAWEILGHNTVRSGSEMEKRWRENSRLTTGIWKLDEALLGGLEKGSLIEFFGPARGAKSQWCHQLAVTMQLPESRGGLDGRTLWLDTESSFRPLTIRANACRMLLDPEEVLSRIFVQPTLSKSHLIDTIKELPTWVSMNDISMVVIDSLGEFFRIEEASLTDQRWLIQELTEIIQQLRYLAKAMQTIIVYTNQVYVQHSTYMGNPNAPVGSNLLSHSSHYRFFTRRHRRDDRKLSLVDHAGIPEFDMEFTIGWGGLYDKTERMRSVQKDLLGYIDGLARDFGLIPDGALAEEGL